MALSNSQYDAIMREYGKRQMENQHSQEARKKEVYEKVPAVKELEAEIAERSVACTDKCMYIFRAPDEYTVDKLLKRRGRRMAY